MIYDHLSNINLYKGLSEDIYSGLCFLKHATPDIENGVYQINSRVKAIVSEYETKQANTYGYEAHRCFIDIQYLISGEEKICCLPIERMTETVPYSVEKEAAFYKAKSQPLEMVIGGGYFAIYYPHDGHMPQLCISEPVKVKKVVVKVEVL